MCSVGIPPQDNQLPDNHHSENTSRCIVQSTPPRWWQLQQLLVFYKTLNIFLTTLSNQVTKCVDSSLNHIISQNLNLQLVVLVWLLCMIFQKKISGKRQTGAFWVVSNGNGIYVIKKEDVTVSRLQSHEKYRSRWGMECLILILI